VILRRALGPGAGEVVRIVPELQDMVASRAVLSLQPSDVARFHLYDGMARFFVRLAAQRPLVLVLEDLHLSDVGSLEFLGFFGPQVPAVPILLVATYPDVEVDPRHPLTSTVARLGYEPAVTRVALSGLGPGEVSPIVAGVAGTEPSAEVAAALYRHTRGNPLFLVELARLLQAEGALSPASALSAAVGDDVRAVISRRLARLPRKSVELLEVAAVVGREFDLEVLEEVTGLTSESVLDRLEAAVLTSVARADPSQPGHYRFTHALVRETAYTNAGTRRRKHLHRQVGEGRERIHGAGDGAHLVRLSHHFFHAGESDVAWAYAVRAADWAMTHLAYEQAEEHLRRALALLPGMPSTSERTQKEAEVQLRLERLAAMRGQASPGQAT
jgi:predicted ATPase